MNFLDNFLDRITMYRLVLYVLIGFLIIAEAFAFFGILPFGPYAIIISVFVLLVVSYIANKVFGYVFETPTNIESFIITALILACIVAPFKSLHDFPILGWVAVWGVASKYIFAYRKKHIFNPAAIAVYLVALFLGRSATWWIGTASMMPFVLIGGLLIVKKIQRGNMLFGFLLGAISVTFAQVIISGENIATTSYVLLFQSCLLFFAFIMLTEPLTSPPTKKLQILFGVLVGILFSPQFHVASVSFTPEQALLIGNIFSFIVSPKTKLMLHLKEKIAVGKGTVDFIFSHKEKIDFIPGQYMEWTLPQKKVDSRGNRRYFTIASSPTEDALRIGVKFYSKGSSYKRTLFDLSENTTLVSSQLAGDFVLPKDPDKKLVFIAGGIGITPFRSMLKFLVDKNQKRDIVMLYSNKTADEIVYTDVLLDAHDKLGIKTIYTLTDVQSVPTNWPGEKGRVSPEMIQREIKDYSERIFYLSGPHAMVSGFKQTLSKLGVSQKQIIEDFFPGFV